MNDQQTELALYFHRDRFAAPVLSQRPKLFAISEANAGPRRSDIDYLTNRSIGM
jgi:hypothetical protein